MFNLNSSCLSSLYFGGGVSGNQVFIFGLINLEICDIFLIFSAFIASHRSIYFAIFNCLFITNWQQFFRGGNYYCKIVIICFSVLPSFSANYFYIVCSTSNMAEALKDVQVASLICDIRHIWWCFAILKYKMYIVFLRWVSYKNMTNLKIEPLLETFLMHFWRRNLFQHNC